MKGLSRRWLTYVLSEHSRRLACLTLGVAALLLTSAPGATAAEPVAVDVRIETAASTIWQGEVETDGCTIKDSGGKDHVLTGAKAACALDEAAKAGGFNYSFSDGVFGLFLTQIDGKPGKGNITDFWLYFVNFEAAQVGLAAKELVDGDQLLLVLEPWPPLPLIRAELSKGTIGVGDSFEVKVTRFDDTAKSFVALEKAQVRFDNKFYETDKDGEVSIGVQRPGDYDVVAEKAGHTRSASQNIRVFSRAVERIAGQSSVQTAVHISQKGWFNGSDAVVLARDDHFADALAGGPLAKYLAYRHGRQAPILLTGTDVLAPDTMAEIQRLGADTVYILGGPGAVGPAVEVAVAKMAGITKVVRLSGLTAYGTALAIKAEMSEISRVEGSPVPDTAVITTGENFADALAVSGAAASKDIPILLVKPFKAEPEAETVLALQGIKKVIIVGGPGAVHPDLEAWLNKAGHAVIARLWGETQYETAIAVVEEGDSLFEFDLARAIVTRGDFFTDALAGGAYASLLGPGPVVLVETDSMPKATAVWLSGNMDSIFHAYLLGGPGAVAHGIEDAIRGALF